MWPSTFRKISEKFSEHKVQYPMDFFFQTTRSFMGQSSWKSTLENLRVAYLPTLQVFPGVSKFFIKSPGLPECLLGDFWRLFLNIVFNDILTMQRFLDVSGFLYSRGWQVWGRDNIPKFLKFPEWSDDGYEKSAIIRAGDRSMH